MKIDKGMEDTVRYFLGLGDAEEASKVLQLNLHLSKEEVQLTIDEVEPMTIEEAFAYMNSD